MKKQNSLSSIGISCLFLIVIIIGTVIWMKTTPDKTKSPKDFSSMTDVTHDGCEYVVMQIVDGANRGYGFMAHKGNCKYCEERKTK